jgi:maleamate amidohydrolase
MQIPTSLTERDRQVYPGAGWGAKVGLGSTPAVLVIDMTYKFTGERPADILESMREHPLSCGKEAWEGVAAIRRLLDASAVGEAPVFYTVMTDFRLDGLDAGRWVDKNPGMLAGIAKDRQKTEKRGNEIVAEIAPTERDFVLVKDKPSAFFGTQLNSLLTLFGVDTLLVTGTTTSGCIRASVIDGFSHNYRVNIVEEGVFDRGQTSHEINLFDMQQKYADVIGVDEAVEYLTAPEPTA